MNSVKDLNIYRQVKDIINQGSRVLLVCGKNPQFDSLAAVLGLSDFLEEVGKTVTTVCPDELPSAAKGLLGWERIGRELAKNFVITLTSAVGNVEKVSYYTEGDDLNLVIHPHPQASPFSPDQVRYKQGGGDYDLIFVLGSQRLSDLGKIYLGEEEMFSKAVIVNIDKQKDNTRFGKLSLVQPRASSISEIVILLLKSLGMKANQKAVTNLLAGLVGATNDFRSSNVLAETFEAAAFCLRSGAQRLSMGKISLPEEKKKPKVDFPQKGASPKQDWLKPKVYQGGQLV